MIKFIMYSLFAAIFIVLLIAISLPNFIGAQDRAKSSSRRAQLYNYIPKYTEVPTESYQAIEESPFATPQKQPLSTFALDVDTASYSNMRRFLEAGQWPPKDAIRTEELINYFPYQYPAPEGSSPLAWTTELSECPWNPKHQLLHLGLQAPHIAAEAMPPSNLVFLLDVSGSMSDENKLPLLKRSLALLLKSLRSQDRVSIVVYAGAAGIVLGPTPGDQRARIQSSLDRLEAGGSTAGGEGIEKAYELAHQQFIPEGNNRVILATDGDFNVGLSSDQEMVTLIEEKRKKGIFLTVLGFGMGNYKDSKLEQLANKGNGNYAYIDNLNEARKVLVHEMAGTLLTVAQDVKLQLAFNPQKVASYRLIGYENRVMPNQDFANDQKDAGEIGAGQTMTALYEIEPTASQANTGTQELFKISLRFKKPGQSQSQLIQESVFSQWQPMEKTSDNFRLAAGVAGFGLLLRESPYKGHANFEQLKSLVTSALGTDPEGYKAELLKLIDQASQSKRS